MSTNINNNNGNSTIVKEKKKRTPKPYERQQNESSKSFEAFRLYCMLGPQRSLAGVSQQLNKSLSLMDRWSSKWSWVERAEAYDDLQIKLMFEKDTEKRLKDLEDLQRQENNLGTITFTASVEIFKKVMDRFKSIDADKIEIGTLPNYLKTSAMLASIALERRKNALALEKLFKAHKLTEDLVDDFEDELEDND